MKDPRLAPRATSSAPPNAPQRVREFLRAPTTREFLWFCAPALLVGLVLRALMTWQMPYGYMQFDSADFLLTAHRLLTRGQFIIHSKRTFLVPLLDTIPFLLKVPALLVIPLAQHLLGLGVVLIGGILTRLWVRPWKWVIVPLTLLLAANPVLLWFEHTLMSESVYLFCVFALALAGTLFARTRSTPAFVFLLAALFFTAGARPEGRLFLGFGLLLVLLVEWGRGKVLAQRLAWLAALALVVLPITRTGQAGQLLYATVLPLAPDESRVNPAFGREVRPLRDEIRARAGTVNDELTSLEQKLTDLSRAHLAATGGNDLESNILCRNLAIEACLNQPWALPALAGRKFLLSTNSPVSIGYDEPRLQAKLNVGFMRKGMLGDLGKGLVGRELRGRDDVAAFVQQHYRPFGWYPFLDDAWRRFTVGDPVETSGPAQSHIPALSAFFLLALAGAALALVTPGPSWRFHAAWLVSLGGLWFAVELTGVINPRYRYVFEPFCLLYLGLGLALVGERVTALFLRGVEEPAAAPDLPVIRRRALPRATVKLSP